MVRITELLGEGIGPELRESLHAVAAVLPVGFEFEEFDLSLHNREERGPRIYDEVMASIDRTHLAIKYPTATEGQSPNAILRRRCGFAVVTRCARQCAASLLIAAARRIWAVHCPPASLRER